MMMGQCVYAIPTVSRDVDTTVVSINVAGVELDDLSDPSQGICAVRIKMKHQFIADVVAELVSPLGQRVRLLGPSIDISASTNLVNWDVQFTRCSFGAFPDAGFDPVWDNLNLWTGFTTYTGTYYPNVGCLENLNMGPVNGEWKLEFIDESQFGSGEIFEFELFFCNTAGLECNTCDSGIHEVSSAIDTFCRRDEAILTSVIHQYTEAPAKPELYDYSYAIFQSDNLVTVAAHDDLTNLVDGDYTICGLSYLIQDSTEVFDIPSGLDSLQFLDYAVNENICFSLSEVCIDITILLSPELITQETSICVGDSLLIDDVYYFAEGRYQIINTSGRCDSVSILELTILDSEYDIESSADSLTCTTLFAHLTPSNLPDTAIVHWTTVDGAILGNTENTEIDAGKPGTYTATIVVGECTFIEEYTVGQSSDYLFAFIVGDTITCNQDTVIADLIYEGDVDSVVWSSTEPFIVDGDDIKVFTDGNYRATIYASNGCVTDRFVSILSDIGLSDVVVTTDTISCVRDTGQISVLVEDQRDYDYNWFFNNSPLGTDSILVVTNAGDYEVVISGDNGCIDTILVQVEDQVVIYDINLLHEPITCNDPIIEVSFSGIVNPEDIIVTWTTPDMSTITTSSFETSEIGEYSLSLLSVGGCVIDTTFTILSDSLVPEIMVGNTTFGCDQDSLRLNLTGNNPSDNVMWEGENMFNSSTEDPWVHAIGDYTVTVTAANGCTVTEIVTVDANVDVPNVDFSYGDLNCINDSVTIVPQDIVNYTFEWTLLDLSVVNANSLTVYEPGEYRVKITDETVGCFGVVTIEIVENFVDSLVGLSVDTLDCSLAVATFHIEQGEDTITSYQWYDPANMPLTTTELEPGVSAPGSYHIDYILENGCMGSDTIEVIRLETAPELSVTSGYISCDVALDTLHATVNLMDYAISWKDPHGIISTGDDLVISVGGEYEVVVMATGNCSDTVLVQVVGDTLAPQVMLISDGNITCLDNLVEIDAFFITTAVQSTWAGPGIVSENGSSIVADASGTYSFTTLGDNGCQGVDTIIIDSEEIDLEYSIIIDTITCVNLSASIEISPDDTDVDISWDEASLIGFLNSVGDGGYYHFTLTDDDGCTAYDSIEIVVDTLHPNPVVDVSNDIDCSFSSAHLVITNPEVMTSYIWNGPGVSDLSSIDLEVNQSGKYILEATNPNGCSVTIESNIEKNIENPTIEIVGDPITCDAGKTILSVNADIEISEWSWSGPNMFISGDSDPLVFDKGTYIIEVTASNGCTAIDSFSVIDLQVFPDLMIEDFYLRCDTDPVQVSPVLLSEGSEMRWFGPIGSFFEGSPLMATIAGEYVGLAINEDGCVTTDTFLVIDQPVPPIFDFLSDSLYCHGDVELIATDVDDDIDVLWLGPEDYLMNGDTVLTGLPGIYNLIVTGTNACMDTVEVVVPDGRSDPIVVITLADPLQCKTEEVELLSEGSASGDRFEYLWTTTNGIITFGGLGSSITARGEGTYFLEILDNHTGCIGQDSLILVREAQSFNDITLDIQSPTCEGFADASIEIVSFDGGFPPYDVILDDNQYGAANMVQYLHSGVHQLVVTDSLGCELLFNVIIEEGDYPEVTLPNDTILLLGDSLLIEPVIFPDTSGLTITWNIPPPCGNCLSFYVTPQANYFLEVTVSNDAGCSYTDDLLINVNTAELVKFPNIFSPNSDGNNDRFYLPFTTGIDIIVDMKIYDWNGALMYGASNIAPGIEELGWDGRYEGDQALQGVYIYEVTMLLTSGEVITKLGDVTLVR